MGVNINDVSVLLNALRSSDRSGMGQAHIINIMQEKYNYIEWQYDPLAVLDIACRLELVEIDDDVVRLTANGCIVAGMGGDNVDLARNQIEYIVEHCVFGNPDFSDLMDFLALFVFNSQRETLVYNMAEYPPPGIETDLFVQLGIVSKDKSFFVLNPDYLLHVSHPHNRVFGKEILEKILAEQNAVGELGESLSLDYEKNRLSGLGLHTESDSVVQISLTDVSAGYDIKSFAGRSIALKHDLFVEVKARKRNLSSFIMSANEIRVAKKLGSRYVIHFWAGLAHHRPVSPTMIIRNPVQELSIKECPCCLSYLITVGRGA